MMGVDCGGHSTIEVSHQIHHFRAGQVSKLGIKEEASQSFPDFFDSRSRRVDRSFWCSFLAFILRFREEMDGENDLGYWWSVTEKTRNGWRRQFGWRNGRRRRFGPLVECDREDERAKREKKINE
jgi:hypothetical protein